ncbi:site-specific integrase, partial [Escherichia coli]|nr:site-specific integrase [Escherichia coli]
MANFAKAEKQAASVMKVLQGTVIRSVGTVRNYEQALTRVCEWVKSSRACDGLRGLTPQLAVEYLETRGEAVGQKTLDMERQ